MKMLKRQILPCYFQAANICCPVLLMMSSLLASWPTSIAAESVEEDQGDPYYGVPLGALHYSAEGTSAEVYAADEFSIIFNHFYHNPREPGCTAMMIGPPRPEDRDNVVPGHGVLVPLAHPPVAARHRARRRRRAAALPRAERFRGYWPVEFDHLLMAPREEEGQQKRGQQQPGKVVKQEARQEVKEPKETKGQQKQSSSVVNSSRMNLSNMSVTEQLLLGNGWALDAPTAPAFLMPSNTSESPPFIDDEGHSTTTEANASSSSSLNISQTSTSSSSTAVSSSAATTSAPMPTQPLILLGGKRQMANKMPAITINEVVVSSNEEPPLMRLVEAGADIRRSPARHNANSEWGGNGKANELDEKGVPPTLVTSTAGSSRSTTPRFWVIKDPREARRQRLIDLRKKLDPNYEPPTTSTTAAPFSPLESQFELPRIRDKLATFALTNGAKVTQYKWIGLWNHCTKRQIPLVSLRDVDPPTEEKIMPLSGWSHNVTSYRLHLLNCNTILVPSFHYDGRNATRNTYFFIGIGQFPEAVEHQTKANVVGQRPGEPLRSYSGEDVLLRLPRPYRTFDIDFISIFNTDEQKSFGHVLIPSLLVPPCPDDE